MLASIFDDNLKSFEMFGSDCRTNITHQHELVSYTFMREQNKEEKHNSCHQK